MIDNLLKSMDAIGGAGGAAPQAPPGPGGGPRGAPGEKEAFLKALLSQQTQDRKEPATQAPQGGSIEAAMNDGFAALPGKNKDSKEQKLSDKEAAAKGIEAKARKKAVAALDGQPAAQGPAAAGAMDALMQSAAAVSAQPAKPVFTSTPAAASTGAAVVAGRRNVPTTVEEMIAGSSMREHLSAMNQVGDAVKNLDPRTGEELHPLRRAPQARAQTLAFQGAPQPEPQMQAPQAAAPQGPSRGAAPAPRADWVEMPTVQGAMAAAAPRVLSYEESSEESSPAMKARLPMPALAGPSTQDLMAALESLREPSDTEHAAAALEQVMGLEPGTMLHGSHQGASSGHGRPEVIPAVAVLDPASGASTVFVSDRGASAGVRNGWEIASAVQSLANRGGGTLKLQLKPVELGDLTVSVTQSRGAAGRKEIALSFVASSREARDALMENMGGLKQSLAARDFEVAAIDVSMGAVEEAVRHVPGGPSVAESTFAQSSWIEAKLSDDGSGGDRDQGQPRDGAWQRHQDNLDRHQQGRGRQPRFWAQDLNA